MSIELEELHTAFIGGGSGPIPIEDPYLDYFPSTDSIVPVSDFGGHTKIIRINNEMAATGDLASRVGVHIRNRPTKRALFTYRHPENGVRTGNDILVIYYKLAGRDIARGIEMAEEDMRPHYVGHVYPVSNEDNVHLKVVMKNGDTYLGEDELDKVMKTPENINIDHAEFTTIPESTNGNHKDNWPHPYKKALDSIRNAHLRAITPGSWEGSIRAVLANPGVYQELMEGEGPIVVFTNAVDVFSRTPDFYLGHIASQIGRKIDLAIVNQPNFKLPENYQNENHFFVEPSQKECEKYAEQVITTPIAKRLEINGIPTIRHSGEEATQIMLEFMLDRGRIRWTNNVGRALKSLDAATASV
jgi:uncharacterized cofD-like protein